MAAKVNKTDVTIFDVEAAVQQMVEDVEASGWLAEKYRTWIIATSTRIVNLDQPLKFRMACRILVRNGITLADLAERAS